MAPMRIAFYAPMKAPDHPTPSGDRRVARLLIGALEFKGHHVNVASRLRTWQSEANESRQCELMDASLVEADKLIQHYRQRPHTAPALWFTYHLYYKAPDWIGPKIASSLSIPYLTAEASVAYKRAGGPWDRGHRAVLSALDHAAAVLTFNPIDAERLPDPTKTRRIAPFIDVAPYREARARRQAAREELAKTYDLDDGRIWLLTVAMMRPGDKLRSYQLLAEALTAIAEQPWHLLVVGDGEAMAETRRAFEHLCDNRLRFLGARGEDALPPAYAASDLFVWPAVNEAFGMAILEAQAAGLPVLAGESPGVAEIVQSGKTGVLVPSGSRKAFSDELRALIHDHARLELFSKGALEATAGRHDIANAACQLDQIITEVANFAA